MEWNCLLYCALFVVNFSGNFATGLVIFPGSTFSDYFLHIANYRISRTEISFSQLPSKESCLLKPTISSNFVMT
jgi:hypothetical protein